MVVLLKPNNPIGNVYSEEHGYECRDCKGNFIFVKPNHDAKLVAERLCADNVLVHPYGNALL